MNDQSQLWDRHFITIQVQIFDRDGRKKKHHGLLRNYKDSRKSN